MESGSCKDGLFSSIAPPDWEKATDFSDSEESECNSSSQTIPLTRQPSLTEITRIANSCSTSPTAKTKADTEEGKIERSVKLDTESAEIAIAVLASANRSSGTQLNSSFSCTPVTPPKPVNPAKTPSKSHSTDEPLTPTANLKMLVSAASPAIRDREIKKRELFTDSDGPKPAVVPSFALPVFDSKVVIRNGSFTRVDLENGSEKLAISRKDKSLGLLCQRFLAKYPENPSPDETIEISLDEVAKDLSVERRRIYDIVNVLESVEVISRFAKNRYMWHGKTRLPQTLQRLKKLAHCQGFSMQSTCSFGKENPESPQSQSHLLSKSGYSIKYPRLLPKDYNIPSMTPKLRSQEQDDEESAWVKKQREADYCRKDKSLGVLSQKFLMMFLISETRQVTLDDAANLLIDNNEEGQAKFKTKVRRLYDIANILSSLQLIQKVHIHNIQTGRKPGFRWIGMDLDRLDEMIKPRSEEQVPPAVKRISNSRQSLLNDIEEKEESLFGRLISRRPSQQQIRQKSENNKSKLPRSRSDRVLTSKTRALSGDEDSSRECTEDGYSIQEISEFQENTVAASPTAVKFQSELKKLQQQYPDRMSQLLSACRQGLLSPESSESKKSRRVLFTRQVSDEDDEPVAKKSKTFMAREASECNPEDNTKTFVHSATSPFKPIQVEETLEKENQKTPTSSKQKSVEDKVQNSPEQKILQEREKQKKLLEEQKNFKLEDERWKRMEKELEKAFPIKPIVQSPTALNQDHSSVGIQASLIEDVSPLKPLSYYVKSLPHWQPLIPRSKPTLTVPQKSATPSPVQVPGVTPMISSPAVTPTLLAPANQSGASVNQVTMATASQSTIAPATQVTMTTINQSMAPVNQITMAPVNQVAMSTVNHVTTINQSMAPVSQITMAPVNQVTMSTVNHVANGTTNQVNVTSVNQFPVARPNPVSMAPHNHVVNQIATAPVNQVASSHGLLSNSWTPASCTPPSGQSTPSPSMYLNMPPQPFNSPALYSPRSLTPCGTPTTDVNMNIDHQDVNQLLSNHGNGSQQLPVTTMTLPISFVNSLINNRVSVGNNINIPVPFQGIRIQTPQSSQGLNKQLVLTPVQGVPGMTVATPILPKGVAPQHMFGSIPGETPSSSATFRHTEVAKSLVMPERTLHQN